jgi:hypothetical protein
MEDQNLEQPKSKKIKFIIWFVILVFGVYALIWVYENYFSKKAQETKQQQKNYEKYLTWKSSYEKAMSEDTYGGKTPEETLNLFIEALKKEDLELASKYFVLNSNGQRDPKWLEALQKTKEAGKLKEVIELLSKAKPDLDARISQDNFVFSARDSKGKVLLDIDLIFNQYSNIWKIESLY